MRTGAMLVLAMLSASVRAEDDAQSQLVVIPSECVQYWSIPGGSDSPAGWNQVLSFAACVQDATIGYVDDVDEIEDLVEDLQSALEPALQLYTAAIERGPGPVKVRAALHIAMAEAALITRARASIAVPADLRTSRVAAARHRDLHDRLEPLLEPQAALACMLVALVDRAVAAEPALVPDAIAQQMLASARRVAALLRKSWSLPDERELEALIVAPR